MSPSVLRTSSRYSGKWRRRTPTAARNHRQLCSAGFCKPPKESWRKPAVIRTNPNGARQFHARCRKRIDARIHSFRSDAQFHFRRVPARDVVFYALRTSHRLPAAIDQPGFIFQHDRAPAILGRRFPPRS